jgi:leader peptidase (prepilin peptidase)/N-methyltransferase
LLFEGNIGAASSMALTITIVFIAGLFLGTVSNVFVIRLPREKNLLGWPRCTRCGRRLMLWQILPIVGWVLQGGRGRCCGQKLNWLFLLIEICLGLVSALFYVRYGFTSTFGYLVFIAVVLIVIGAIDWLHRHIYHLTIFVPALIMLLVSWSVPDLGLVNSLFGALIAAIIFVIFFVPAQIWYPGQTAFGLGDVYLGILIGMAVGWTNLLPVIAYGVLLAAIAALILIMRRPRGSDTPTYFSYGTFLCLGALSYLLLWGLQGI